MASDATNLETAAKAIIHQRDHFATHGNYDVTTFRPDEDQCFDDWAADILSQAMDTDVTIKSRQEARSLPAVRPLTEGMVRKGGRNHGPSQIKDRPPPPAPINVKRP